MLFSLAQTADAYLPRPVNDRLRRFAVTLDEAIAGESESGRAGRMSLIAFTIRVCNAAIAYLSQVLLARWMGVFDYGVFTLVWVSVMILGNLSCLGFQTAVIRFVPEYRTHGLIARVRGVMLASRLIAFVSASVVAAIGIGLVLLLQNRLPDHYLVPLVIGLSALPMIALSDVLQGISRAHQWAVSALSPVYLIRPILLLVFMIGALAAGAAPTAPTALVCAVAATYCATIWQLVFVTSKADRLAEDGRREYSLRPWLAIAMPIFLVESFFFLLTNADVLMIGMVLTPQDVAIYYATVKTLVLVHFVTFAVKAGAAQAFSQLANDADPNALGHFARRTVAWTFWPTLALSFVVLAIGPFMLALFGELFLAGYPLLFVLLVGNLVSAAIGPAESLLTMTGRQSACAMIYGASLAANVSLNFLLLPIYGLWGAAIATSVTLIGQSAALFVAVLRTHGFAMIVRPFGTVSRAEP